MAFQRLSFSFSHLLVEVRDRKKIGCFWWYKHYSLWFIYHPAKCFFTHCAEWEFPFCSLSLLLAGRVELHILMVYVLGSSPTPPPNIEREKTPRVFWLNRLCHRARAKNVRIEAFQGKKAAKGHMIPETQPRLKSEKKLVVVLPNFRLFLVEKAVGAPLIITWCPDEILFVKPAEFTASCLFSPCLLL